MALITVIAPKADAHDLKVAIEAAGHKVTFSDTEQTGLLVVHAFADNALSQIRTAQNPDGR